MYVHRDIEVNINNILDRFAKNKRKIDLLYSYKLHLYTIIIIILLFIISTIYYCT